MGQTRSLTGRPELVRRFAPKPRAGRKRCCLKYMRPAGLEPTTCGLGNRRSIQLSYERLH